MTSPKFIIRVAREEDVDTVLELVKDLLDYEGFLGVDIDSVDNFRQEMKRGVVMCYVAEETIHHSVVAMSIFLKTYSVHIGRGIHVEGMYVREPWRSRGLCSALLIAIVRQAFSMKSNYVELQAVDWNENAWSRYHSIGFRNTCNRNDMLLRYIYGEAMDNLGRQTLQSTVGVSSEIPQLDHQEKDVMTSASKDVKYLIRVFTKNDLQSVVDLITKEDPTVDNHKLEDGLLSGELDGLLVEETNTGQLQGLCLYRDTYTVIFKSGVHVEWCHVVKSAHGQGLGRALLSALSRIVLSRERAGIFIKVLSSDTTTISILSHLGFQDPYLSFNIPLLNWELCGDSFNQVLSKVQRQYIKMNI